MYAKRWAGKWASWNFEFVNNLFRTTDAFDRKEQEELNHEKIPRKIKLIFDAYCITDLTSLIDIPYETIVFTC